MRKQRLAEILSIVREHKIENQEMLITMLRERGYDVTQATVSRDINELRLEKSMTEDGTACYVMPSAVKSDRFQGIFAQSVISVDHAMNIVVLKCHPGLANAACAAIDSMYLQGVVGTLAGDDTIFVLARTEKDTKDITEVMFKML